MVHDAAPYDVYPYDIPAESVGTYISDHLNIPYLSKYEGGKEELKKIFKYEGKIIGNRSRIFISVPTARYNS